MMSKQVILKVNKNWDLIRGKGKHSRSKMYYKRGPGTSRPKIEVFFPPKAPGAVGKCRDDYTQGVELELKLSSSLTQA